MMGLHYGVGLSYSLLENAGFTSNRWDLRLTANIGGYWIPWLTPQIEYIAGIPAAYYPFSHWGIYGDLQWGHSLYNGNGKPLPGFCIQQNGYWCKLQILS